MPALIETDLAATVTWLGVVGARDTALQSQPRDVLRLGFDGPEGEAHGGSLRPACSRVAALYARDTPIRNVRQLSILAAEELAEIAADMGLEALDPALLGATMVVSGLPDFSHLPPRRGCWRKTARRWWSICRTAPASFPRAPSRMPIPAMGGASNPQPAGGAA